jgi:hypothetical protein
MKKDIKKALEEASAVEDKATVDNELSPRQKIILAKKKNSQRRRRNKLPSSLR